MKIKNARITILVSEGGAVIQIHDRDASVQMAEVRMTSAQFCAAIGRQGYVECEMEVCDLSRVGKAMEMKELVFGISVPEKDRYDREKMKKIAIKAAKTECPEGWIPDTYYGSQNSFYIGSDGVQYARTLIRRWVEKRNA